MSKEDEAAFELRVAKAMFYAVRGKDGTLVWGEVEPITEAYLTGARAAIAEMRALEASAEMRAQKATPPPPPPSPPPARDGGAGL